MEEKKDLLSPTDQPLRSLTLQSLVTLIDNQVTDAFSQITHLCILHIIHVLSNHYSFTIF